MKKLWILPLLLAHAIDRPAQQPRHQRLVQLQQPVAPDQVGHLLEPAEQRLFRRLSVFAGGCELDAVTAVAGGDVPTDFSMIDGVSALIAEIRRERRIELFIEGFRYDDLRRWKQGKKLDDAFLATGVSFVPVAKGR